MKANAKAGKIQWLRVVLIAVFSCMFIYSGYQLAIYFIEANESEAVNEDLIHHAVVILPDDEQDELPPDTAEKLPETEGKDSESTADTNGDTAAAPDSTEVPADETETAAPPEPAKPTKVPLTVDFDALHKICPDIIAWLYVKGTSINYPVVQSDDNQYYLYRLITGENNKSGTIFADCRNSPTLDDLNTVLYGHHMRNGTMFASLVKFKKQAFFDDHQVGWILTPDQAYRIDFVAGYVTTAVSDGFKLYTDEAEFADYLGSAVKKSTFKSDVDLSSIEKIITLSTCSYEYSDARYVLIGSLIPMGD